MIRIHTDELAKDLQQLEADIRASANQALGQAAAYARQLAVSTTRFNDRTGNLRASIVRGTIPRGGYFVQAGSRGVKYAGFIEFGTKRGIKPRLYMTSARDRAEEQLGRFIEAGLNSLIH